LLSAQAQYYHDAAQLPKYLEDKLLPNVNQQRGVHDAKHDINYAPRAARRAWLVLFERDCTVVPKESAWFGSYAPPPLEDPDSGDSREGKEEVIMPMHEQPLFKEDWIGLRALEHMLLSEECWKPLVKNYVGSPRCYATL
jgi:palmitoyl-protein thioesterase